jgi:hypothetical protein
MKEKRAVLWCLPLMAAVVLLITSGCAGSYYRSDSYKLSDAYFAEVRDNEDGLVMDHFYRLNDYLVDSDFKGVVEQATEGIDAIPKYRELFAYFYAMRAYANIMLYNLEKGAEDINNLQWFEKDSSMIDGLWAYYYFSYAPFDTDPKKYYLKAKESVGRWRAARPLNTFELFFSDPKRIADLEKIIDDELRK